MNRGNTASKFEGRITFDEDIGWSGRKSGEFYYDKDSFALISFSYDQRHEIGDYVAMAPHDQLSAAHAKLIASRYRERVDPEFVPPETKFFNFREGSEPRLYGFVQYAVPKEVQPAVDAFRELIEWMRQHPNRTIRGSAQLKKRELTAAEPIDLTVRLESVGGHAAVIGNPFMKENDRGGLKLAIDHEGERISEFELGSAQRVVTKKLQEGDTIRLEPKEAWEARLRKDLYLTPGRYSLSVIYRSNLQYEYGKEELNGELPIDLGEIVVR